jgi:hypothetical protein
MNHGQIIVSLVFLSIFVITDFLQESMYKQTCGNGVTERGEECDCQNNEVINSIVCIHDTCVCLNL